MYIEKSGEIVANREKIYPGESTIDLFFASVKKFSFCCFITLAHLVGGDCLPESKVGVKINEKYRKVNEMERSNINDNVCGKIRSTIGKAILLTNKKGRFEQFRTLIENCEFGLGEKATTCMDLQVSI